MTLTAAYNEVTISPMNTDENEPQAAEIRRMQWANTVPRRSRAGLSGKSRSEHVTSDSDPKIDQVAST